MCFLCSRNASPNCWPSMASSFLALKQYPASTRQTPRTHRHSSMTRAEPMVARISPEYIGMPQLSVGTRADQLMVLFDRDPRAPILRQVITSPDRQPNACPGKDHSQNRASQSAGNESRSQESDSHERWNIKHIADDFNQQNRRFERRKTPFRGWRES